MTKKTNNSRKINALLPKKFLKTHIIKRNVAIRINSYLLLVFIFQAIMLLIALGFISFLLNEKELAAKDRQAKYVYWGKVASKFPDRPDVLFNMAKSSYENGKSSEAVRNLQKAREIDPLFEKAKKLLEEIK